MLVLDQLLQNGYQMGGSFDRCFGLFSICGYLDGVVTFGALIGGASAGLVLLRRLRKLAIVMR